MAAAAAKHAHPVTCTCRLARSENRCGRKLSLAAGTRAPAGRRRTCSRRGASSTVVISCTAVEHMLWPSDGRVSSARTGLGRRRGRVEFAIAREAERMARAGLPANLGVLRPGGPGLRTRGRSRSPPPAHRSSRTRNASAVAAGPILVQTCGRLCATGETRVRPGPGRPMMTAEIATMKMTVRPMNSRADSGDAPHVGRGDRPSTTGRSTTRRVYARGKQRSSLYPADTPTAAFRCSDDRDAAAIRLACLPMLALPPLGAAAAREAAITCPGRR